MLPLYQYVKTPKKLVVLLLQHYGGWIPDRVYLKWLYRVKMGKKLDLKNPKTYSEKLQWLKLYDRKPEYTMMVDKYAVKDYVAGIIGERYIIPTIGVWNKLEDIEWDILPDKFVIKTTYGGGSSGVVICKDKSTFDKNKAIAKLKRSMKQDIYRSLREWPYKDVPRKILAEEYINPAPIVTDLPDYKWYCFNGEPKYCQVICDRSSKETIDFFDIEWNHQDFIGLNPVSGSKFKPAANTPSRPQNLELQVEIARKLSKDIPFSRVDIYEVDEKEYFGEITFYPASGFGVFDPDRYNEVLGEMLVLPGEKLGGGNY